MTESLKKFRVKLEYDLVIQPITRESFTANMEAYDEGTLTQFLTYQQELQRALLADPTLLAKYIKSTAAGFSEAYGREIAEAAFGQDLGRALTMQVVDRTIPLVRDFFERAAIEGQLFEQIEEFDAAFQFQNVTGSITEL